MRFTRHSFTGICLAAAAFSAASSAVTARAVRAADHRDAPNMIGDPQADLLDAFAFVNAANGKVVLAVTCCPFIVPGTTQSFGSDLLYQFKIDNTGDFRRGRLIQVTVQQAADRHADRPRAAVTVVGPVAVKGGKGKLDRQADQAVLRRVTSSPATSTRR